MLYVVFCLSSALWALEVAQLIGLVDLLLSPDGLPTDALFNRFYDLIASETRVTSILFQAQVSVSPGEQRHINQRLGPQMVVGDILVIWRSSAIWYNRRAVVLLPLFWWTLLIGMHVSMCSSYSCAHNL